MLTEETLVAEQIRSLFYDCVLPEVDYDAAKVVKDKDSDYGDGEYGKSYNDIRKEQLEEGEEKEQQDRQEDHNIDEERHHQHHHGDAGHESDEESHSTEPGHQKSPSIDKPYNPNHRQ